MRIYATLAVSMVIGAGSVYGADRKQKAESKPVTPVVLSAAESTAVEAGVRNALKDPESSRFGEFAAGKDDKQTTMVCGYVNAKNAFGGYVGASPFVGGIVNDKFVPIKIGSTAVDARVVIEVCKDIGLDVRTLARQRQ